MWGVDYTDVQKDSSTAGNTVYHGTQTTGYQVEPEHVNAASDQIHFLKKTIKVPQSINTTREVNFAIVKDPPKLNIRIDLSDSTADEQVEYESRGVEMAFLISRNKKTAHLEKNQNCSTGHLSTKC